MDFEQDGAAFASQNNASSAYSVMSYDEWLKSGQSGLGTMRSGRGRDYSVFGNIADWFTGDRSYLEKAYQDYLNKNQREYEQQQINDARRYNEYMESTKYQRMVKDLKASGLNPWLALQNGLGNASVNSGSASYSTSALKRSEKKPTGDGKAALAGIIGVANVAARIIAALIAA